MNKRLLILFILTTNFSVELFSQSKNATKIDTSGFNYAYWNAVADKQHLNAAERKELIDGEKNHFFYDLEHEHDKPEDLIWITQPSEKLIGGGNTINAGPCTNIDFEDGTMNGWVRSTGVTNPTTGCCPTNNAGDQTIMTGGNDAHGGFPRVWPGGGGFSLRLGSTAVGGRADRISQTFFVTPANANFTYRYAVVLNVGPAGNHNVNTQPRFTSEIIDTLGNQVPCTFYQVSAGSALGFTNSPVNSPNDNTPVVYRGWTDVLVDLTPNIGQNVTMRFTVYDCVPSGHYAYAYIDGLCTDFPLSVSDTTCPNIPLQICAPLGFSTTVWNGPGVFNNPNRCINVTQPGTYTCTTVLIPGCPGPTLTHTLNLLPNPIVSFTPVVSSGCSPQYTFNGSLGISSGSLTSFIWDFGDGTSSSSSLNQTHVYASPGTYQVKLKAFSNRGCRDSLVVPVTIFPTPNLVFSPPSNCINTVIQFTNTSTVAPGSITGYTWNFGNGVNSNLVNPTNSYTANGTYTITLTGISNQGCLASLSQTLGIFPPPIISFSANPLCDINGTSFSPSTSTAIVSGNLATYFWDFGDGGTSTAANPVHIYAAPGLYTVNFSAVSNHNCPAATSNTFLISPSPTVAFATTSVNACANNFTFTNNSAIAAGSVSYTWNFGGGNVSTSTVSPLTYTFPGIGDYTVSLIGVSNMGCGDTMLHYISIYPYPVINFSVPASCENAIFTVSTTAVSGSVTSYLWDFGDPLSGPSNTSTLQNPTHFYNTTNSFVITLNLISNLNCPSTTVTPIVVFPNPVASFTPNILNNCAPTLTFVNGSTVSTIGASSVVSNLWNFGGFTTTSLSNPGTHTFPGNGSYSVSLIATTNHNCSDTAITTILIHPNPQINFTLSPTCLNVPLLFPSTASISPIPLANSSITAYVWDFGDATFTNVAVPSAKTYTASGNYTITFSATSNMGCVSSVSNSLAVYPSPVSDFTTTSLNCFGGLSLFTSTSSIPTGTIYGYNWDFGDGTFGSNPSTSHTYSTTGNFPVTFSTTTNNECVTVVTKTITVHPLPVVSYTANGGCLNVVSLFAGTSTIAAGSVVSYTYNFGDGNNSPNQTTSHTYSVFGTFTPTLFATSNQSCTSSGINTVVIHPLPNIAFSPPGACVNSAIQFTNSSSVPLGSITSYSWDFADGTNSSVIHPLHTYTFASIYNVTLTASTNQGCTRTTTSNLAIYPYPTITITPVTSACTFDQVLFSPNISITGSNNPISGYTVSYGDGSPVFTSTVLNLSIPHVYNAFNTYTVTVSAISNGCSTSTIATVNVYPRPFTNFVSSNYCFNDSVSFVNTSTIAATYSINSHFWFFNDGASTSTVSSPRYKFSGPGIYSVSLTESSNYPAVGLTCSLSAIKVITINPTPGATFTNNSVCFGNPTSFTSSTNGISITGLSWYFYNTNQVNSIQTNPVYTYTNYGTFLAKLKALNGFGCKDSSVQSVVVHPNPASSFIADSVCFGLNTTFAPTSTIAAGGTVVSYSWNFGGGNTSIATNPAFNFTTAGTHTVELTSLSNEGCTNRAVASVSVHHLPNIIISVNDACLGKPSTFINQSSIQVGSITNYLWNFGNGSSSGLKDPIVTYTTIGSYTVQLNAISDKQCSATRTLNVIVRDNPIANFFNTKTLCTGDNVAFTNLSSSSDGTITGNYWDFNGDNFVDNTNTNPSVTYTVPGSIVVKLDVVTQYGCLSTRSVNLFVNPKAVPRFASNNNKGCPSLCVKFENLSFISNGAISSYTWNFGDGNVQTNVFSPTNCYNSGSYNVSLTAISDSGCVSRLSQPGFVTVYNLPTADFFVDPEEVDEDEPFVTVTSNAAEASFTKYYINDGTSYTGDDFQHTFTSLNENLPMIVQIVNSPNGCVDTTYKVLKIKPAFTIYFPNVFTPNEDGTNDTYQPKGIGISKFNLWIYDRWGSLVFETDDITNQWDGTVKEKPGAIKQDVFTWKAKVVDVFNKTHDYTGHVTVIR